ncbi:MAG: polysaccharide biosynthesis/export family protein [Candidatus Devosia phytovorans]|uniref:Polysaccharide biosynthesis/export family protein n=1 Tax=Candidatus Devosia phytovorans TaxID=3121372 RepID=A0AAJ5VSX5_9HYPH|nr:polysaccharide biosynthesis/export family protein [Devosia sp.]WEK03717.1 MAG: polysaccharide biosynthesis/export family protein [Devosia sp.]
MHATKLFSLLCFLFCAQPVFAQSTYRLQPGDAVEIWVAQSADLTRNVTLAPDGWISMPLAGAMQAQGMTIEALQGALIDRLQPFFKEDVGLNVSLVPSEQNQPSIFIAGDVEAPGQYPFRPGMTVLHAVSVAGGLYRTALEASDRDRSMEVQGLIANGQKRMDELNIIIARLNAQIAGQDEFTVPAEVSAAGAAGFAGREQSLMTMQDNNIRDQQAASARLTTINQESIAAIDDQIKGITERIALSQERLSATSTLAERGVVQASQVREIEVNIVDMQTSISQLRTSIATQQAAIMTEQSRVATLVQQYHVGLVTDLSAAEREREALTEDLANYLQTLSLYEPSAESPTVLRYEIIRTSDSGELDVDATERSTILAGDLIRVTMSTLDAEPGTSAATPVPDNTTSLPTAVSEPS